MVWYGMVLVLEWCEMVLVWYGVVWYWEGEGGFLMYVCWS